MWAQWNKKEFNETEASSEDKRKEQGTETKDHSFIKLGEHWEKIWFLMIQAILLPIRRPIE